MTDKKNFHDKKNSLTFSYISPSAKSNTQDIASLEAVLKSLYKTTQQIQNSLETYSPVSVVDQEIVSYTLLINAVRGMNESLEQFVNGGSALSVALTNLKNDFHSFQHVVRLKHANFDALDSKLLAQLTDHLEVLPKATSIHKGNRGIGERERAELVVIARSAHELRDALKVSISHVVPVDNQNPSNPSTRK